MSVSVIHFSDFIFLVVNSSLYCSILTIADKSLSIPRAHLPNKLFNINFIINFLAPVEVAFILYKSLTKFVNTPHSLLWL
jgi:hypothetical protein